MAIVGFAGFTVRDSSVASTTVSVVELVIFPKVALIIVAPFEMEVASPLVPIVATFMFEEFQVTSDVKSWVVLSEKVPIAVNCCFNPLAKEELLGATARDWRTADVTVSVAEAVLLPNDAEIVVVPTPVAVARPELLIVATPAFDEVHVTVDVRFGIVLSVYVPVAVNC